MIKTDDVQGERLVKIHVELYDLVVFCINRGAVLRFSASIRIEGGI